MVDERVCNNWLRRMRDGTIASRPHAWNWNYTIMKIAVSHEGWGVPKTRILIVDDSVVIRRVLTEELSAEAQFEVAGTAPNGKIALAKLTQINPDIVILDVEMPEMDGLETLPPLRKLFPRMPVIMFSSLTERGAMVTLDALSRGATDYFAKPATASLEDTRTVIRSQLIPTLKGLCRPTPTTPAPLATPIGPISGTSTLLTPKRIDALIIGVSTGGPNALVEVFGSLPATLPVPIFIVQHMPPMFTRLLAERLTAASPVVVEEAIHCTTARPGRAYLAPGDYHMMLTHDRAGTRIVLNQDPPENSCRPAADPLFRSAAKLYGANLLAVVLTGMGHDGLRGCEEVKAVGGAIIVQDEATSVVWGMPGAVARAGLAEKIVPLPLMASEIIRRINSGRGTRI
jgi:two-component system, chemotaxis family, protein-glutamate methylesterase/glutaminase